MSSIERNMLDMVHRDAALLEYQRIVSYASGGSNDETLACMLANWQEGGGTLPDYFGLTPQTFKAILDGNFPGLDIDSLRQPGRTVDGMRTDEYEEVCTLLLTNRADLCESETWMAQIVARSCQGQDHLWQDMGLWSRNQLSALMLRNFPDLAARNVNNMKWKKFIYKQLCVAEGIYTCRAPSCEICVDYDHCFGPAE